MICPRCGRSVADGATFCTHCGAPMAAGPAAVAAAGASVSAATTAAPPSVPAASVSDKRILPALLLCFFLGWVGAHRFYTGKIGTAILIILTCGGFLGIWPLIDFILIVTG